MAYNLKHLCQEYLPFKQWVKNLQNHNTLSQKFLPSKNPRSHHIFSQNIEPLTQKYHKIDINKQALTNSFSLLQPNSYQRSYGVPQENTDKDLYYYDFQSIKMKGEQIRQKILKESKQQDLKMDKMEGKISQILERLKFMGKQRIQLEAKQQKLIKEQAQLYRMIKQAQRINICRKQDLIEEDRCLGPQLQGIKEAKRRMQEQKMYRIEQIENRNCEQFVRIEREMSQRLEILQKSLKKRLDQKNNLRNEMVEYQTSKMNQRVEHEKQLLSCQKNTKNNPYIKNKILIQISNLENQIKQKQADTHLQQKMSKISTRRLLETKIKRINKKSQLLQQIYDIHLRIKEKHMQMAATNLEVESKNIKDKILCGRYQNLSSQLCLLDYYTKQALKKGKENNDFGEVYKKLWRQFYEEGVSPVLYSQIIRLQSAVKQEQKRKRIFEDKYQKLRIELQGDTSKLLKKNFHTD